MAKLAVVGYLSSRQVREPFVDSVFLGNGLSTRDVFELRILVATTLRLFELMSCCGVVLISDWTVDLIAVTACGGLLV